MAAASDVFEHVDVDRDRHHRLVREAQRLRGSIYLKDGAIQEEHLSPGGFHQTPEDETSWHMLLLNRDQQVSACALYTEHDHAVTFEGLRVGHSALAHDPTWRHALRNVIESELATVRRHKLKYVELGGWAVSEESRGTAGPMALALAVWGFGLRRGGGLGMTTATFRHCSATILKRLGGSRFDVDGTMLPPYFEPRYGCMMEMLRFDSRKPVSKYLGLIDQVRDALHKIPVVACPAPHPGDVKVSGFSLLSPGNSGFALEALGS
jgi:hypothetical protein